MKYYTCICPSPLGDVTLTACDKGLCTLRLPGQPGCGVEDELLSSPEDHPVLALTARWLGRYFTGQAPDPRELPLNPVGTPFRQLVWELLLEIPYGTAVTYGSLAREAARRLGKERMSAQAVGGAVGANPIAIVIPCHRCLASGNRLGGYAGGTGLKRKLLELERIGYFE